MTRGRKARTEEGTIKNIKHRIPYGPDERARVVEHVCGVLLDSRFRSGGADDIFYIDRYDGEDVCPTFIELLDLFASRPVSMRCEGKFIELTPGQAMHLFLTDQDCGLTIIEGGTIPNDVSINSTL